MGTQFKLIKQNKGARMALKGGEKEEVMSLLHEAFVWEEFVMGEAI